MADYWKSQDKKYCEFCKCWIADNKVSRDFHESGRRHQENVKKKLKYITKNSNKVQRENEKADSYLRQMESAAMAAYRKDVENNADLTSMAINKKVQEENLEISGSKKVWQELKDKEGNAYYWNTLTNETKWEAPAEGYLSLEEKRNLELNKTKKEMDALDKEKRKEGIIRMQAVKKEEEEERARAAREKMKELRVPEDDIPTIEYKPIIEPGKNDAYGGWQTVKEEALPDLQLPGQSYYNYSEAPVEYEPEPIAKEFKEKTVDSLESHTPWNTSTSFKKRKIVSGSKKNARQRTNDD